jgi:transposase-like protein
MRTYRSRRSGKFVPMVSPETKAAILSAVSADRNYVDIAKEFGVSIGFISKLVSAARRAGTFQPPRPAPLPPVPVLRQQPQQPLTREEYERRLVEQTFRAAAAAGTLGGLDGTRQKFYHEDEFGYGYIDDK